jgi:hypothetical protein
VTDACYCCCYDCCVCFVCILCMCVCVMVYVAIGDTKVWECTGSQLRVVLCCVVSCDVV